MSDNLEALQKRFNTLCDKQDKLYHKEFEDVFAIIYNMDENTNKDFPFSNETVAKQALEKVGYINDSGFVANFFEYERLFREGKDIQVQMLALMAKSMPTESEQSTDEWRFVSVRIIAPQPIMQMIDEVIINDAIVGKGLFANLTEIPDEDEELDKYLMIDAYGLKCSFVPFLDDLKNHGITDDFLKKDFTRLLFQILIQEAEFIKDNTTAPAKVKNHISKTIKVLDGIPVWGIFFQILTLQGLCRWLEEIDINDGDDGYKEAQSLYNWICKHLMSKEIEFCYKPYGKSDKELLKPLCNYLYSTELGKLVQSGLFEENTLQQSDKNNLIPEELNTQQANNLFTKAIEANFIEKTRDRYMWKGQANELAAFIDCSSIALNIRPSNNRVPWKLYKQALNLSEKEVKAAKDAKKDYDMERRAKPDKWTLILNICNM